MKNFNIHAKLLLLNLLIFATYSDIANAAARVTSPSTATLTCPNLPKGTYSYGQQLNIEGNTWWVWLGQSGNLDLPNGITWPTNTDWNHSYSIDSGMSGGGIGRPSCFYRDNNNENRISITLMEAGNYSCSETGPGPFNYQCYTNSFKPERK